MYSGQQKNAFNDLSNVVVDALISNAFRARVGHSGGLAYPSIRYGAWTIAMMWDDGFGWSCYDYEKIGGPHWHWFLSSNLDNFGRAYATGVSLRLFAEPGNPKLIEFVMRYVCHDPCRLPYALCTPNFVCPSCSGDWNRPQYESEVMGKFSTPLVKLEPDSANEPSEEWNHEDMMLIFGTVSD